VSQTILDFSGYIKFFVGLFALVNPVGILPVFISMTSYQAAAGRNKTNMTANLSVAIILCTSLFLGDAILHLFGISIDSFRIAGGILVVTIAMSMISGKLGEDKQNKQEKSETAIRENVGVVPLALPLIGRSGGNQFHHRLEFALSQLGKPAWIYARDRYLLLLLLVAVPRRTVGDETFGANRY
jgi:MarC family membrane protein